MRRLGIGLALLSTSWLFGLGYYHDASWPLWTAAVLAGTVLLVAPPVTVPGSLVSIISVLMLLPAIALLGWPYRAAPLLIAVGLVLCAARIPRRWPRMLGSGVVLAGTILLVQSATMALYAWLTARSHELPLALARLLVTIVRRLGTEAALDGTTLTLRTVRAVHRLGATWELLLDPVTLCFLAGAVVLVGLARLGGQSSWQRVRRKAGALTAVLLVVAVWLPVRVAILLALFLHRDFRTDYAEPLALMNQFWSPWLHLALLAGPVFLAFHCARVPRAEGGPAPAPHGSWRISPVAVTVFVFAGAFLLTAAWCWEPMGTRKAGRVLVDEYHSQWEPTQRPYDANWYGPEAGYNYACIYDYCSHFYEMARLETPVDSNALADYDVLVIKTPTSRFQDEEVAAITRFVQDGGGVLLIGDHTNVFKTGTCLNDIARCFGFTFRHDCLWDIDTIGQQLYRVPTVPHPIVQNMPRLDFAVGCSIDPGRSRGCAVIRSTGLKSVPADYHIGNFMPPIEDRAENRYGAFIQLWATRHGAGRVAAFTDSTIFSNFATFEPGKAELMLGMVEWLDHGNVLYDPRPWLVLPGGILVALGLIATRRGTGAWLLLLAAGMLGWTGAAMTVRAMHAACMPAPKAVRPYVHVVMDRTLCDTLLSQSGVITGQANGFGIFERWVLRLGYFTSRQRGRDAFRGDLLVLSYPSRTVPREYLDGLVRYVASGGKVLVLDSPENSASTANSLLYPFGLAVERTVPFSGALKGPADWPSVQATAAYQTTGGEPLMRLGDVPVAARARQGKGAVTVVGFGSRFSDANMGVTGEVVPDENMRRLFDLEFALLRSCVVEP